ADIGLGVDQPAEHAGIDLLPDPAEMAFAPPLIAERQNHARPAAGLGDGAAIRHLVGDRLVEKDVLARGGCGGRGPPKHTHRAGGADVVARCTSFSVVLMIASTLGSARISS